MGKEVTFDTFGIFAWPAVGALAILQVWFAFFTPVSVGEWLVDNVVQLSLTAQVPIPYDVCLSLLCKQAYPRCRKPCRTLA
jgi:hypothetical protein